MAFASTKQLALDARAGGYAVPAVNIVDGISIAAAVRAADAAGSPIILQTSVKTVKYFGARTLADAARAAADEASVPVALHLDHCPDRAVITEAIAHGWSSVLFDASDRDFETARAETAEVTAEAHAAGVDVESEIENIVGVEDGVGSDDPNVHYYSDEALVGVAAETQTDLIAPALGTAHGLYKASPVLLVDRVRSLAALTDIPIVLHGGTGLSPEEFAAFIDAGVSKINISTQLKLAYMHSARDHLAEAERSGKWEPVKLFDQIGAAVGEVITENATLFRSAGKAAAAVTA
ncbi:class II fructose-bisphosphate aldolase [Schumannella soli]|uniref:Class II fructose-bisphosphate aldolase n=1 Tax=Schumannella soli TaxID=2590779 RepID=A0A506Y1M1_9MICO|nr:class II fructose-bisphosphate aldolase [Schumannella soli]TPW74848.1 class II fructose-bisphosphate aldolase [Schumannella soli]